MQQANHKVLPNSSLIYKLVHLRHRTIIFALLVHTLFVGQLFDRQIWRDEASSVWFAEMSLGDLLLRLCDPHPPGYYMVLHGWQQLGMQPLWLRLPSLFGSLVALCLLFVLARGIFGRKIAHLSLLLLTLFPVQLWYAAEVRMYALVQMAGVAAALLAWRVWQQPKRHRAIICWLGLTLLCWLDYSAILVVGIIQILWLAQRRPQQRTWIAINVATLCSTVGIWIWTGQLFNSPDGYQAIFLAVRANEFGIALTPETASYILFLLLVGGAVVSLVSAFYWQQIPQLQSLLPLLFGIGWLGLMLVSGVPRLYTVKRLVMVILPFLALGAAVWLAYSARWLRWLYLGTTVLIALIVVTSHQKEDWQTVVQVKIPQLVQDETMLYVDELIVPLVAYHARDSQLAWETVGSTQLDKMTNATSDSIVIVTLTSKYRDLPKLLPHAFYQQYKIVNEVDLGVLGLFRYERGETEGYTPPDEIAKWGLLLPSPLTMCR